jgi:hypothetical protein
LFTGEGAWRSRKEGKKIGRGRRIIYLSRNLAYGMLCIISYSVHFKTCLETWLTECCVSYPFQFFSPLSKVKDEPRDDSLEMVDSQNSQRLVLALFALAYLPFVNCSIIIRDGT